MMPDREVVEYFVDLGFEVDWDRSRSGMQWYELRHRGQRLVQIDFGATVDSLKEDLPLLVQGKVGTSNVDWEVRFDEDWKLQMVVERMTNPSSDRTCLCCIAATTEVT